ncbi:hypothetical protein [Aestuariivita sp.]|uniref:hypothetical protein n=1 Tax=Aestuariivita sp. TaxID=1872407 RepID=UPI00216DBE6D|nr:hypothetical protein [Aestuariivita sp.]MCE8009050.1 hypothetical protein [Aestuariivita sp.]
MTGGAHLTLRMGPVIATPVSAAIVDSVVEVQTTEASKGRSGFQLRFTYSEDSEMGREVTRGILFEPPNRVIISITLAGREQVLADGIITRQDFAPSNQAGQATLSLTGTDVSQMMDLVDISAIPMPPMPPFGRVAFLLAKYAMYGVVPAATPSLFLAVSNPLERIEMQAETDYAYINRLAREAGYIFFVAAGPAPGMNIAYWGPEVKVGPTQSPMRINMDGESNIDSFSVSYDGLKKNIYFVFYRNDETHVNIPIPVPGINPINPPLGRRPPFPMGYKLLNRRPPARERDEDDEEADTAADTFPVTAAKALGQASRNAEIISASGSLDVTRYGEVLRARRLVEVQGAGHLHSGAYYVDSVTSTLKPGSFKQNFRMTRNARVAW